MAFGLWHKHNVFPYSSTKLHFWPVRGYLKDCPQNFFYSHKMVGTIIETADLKYSMLEKDSDLIALFGIVNIVICLS